MLKVISSLGALLLVLCLPILSDGGEKRGTERRSAKSVTTASGLRFIDLVVGTGRKAKPGDTATVHYTGWLADGTKFDSSLDRNDPYSFRIGSRGVIKAWNEGVVSMKKGGTRRLIIPPHLGYGSRGAGDGVIPPNATLTFEVELLDLR